MSISLVEELQRKVNDRQQDLTDTQVVLEDCAAKESGRSKKLRVLIIFLGAFAATQAVADKLLGPDSTFGTVIYALVGLLIALLAGMEASFGFQKKTGELKKLAVECNAYVLDIVCKIPQDANTTLGDQIDALRELLALQNTALKDIRGKAAGFGVNITRKIRNLRIENGSSLPNIIHQGAKLATARGSDAERSVM